MNEQLQTLLLDLVQQSITTLESGATFLAGEIPEVIQQLLIWYAVKNGIFFLLGTLLLVIMVVVLVKYSGQGKSYKTEYQATKYKWTLTHDDDGNVGPQVIATGVFCFVGVLIAATLINMVWLQILVAPKLFLIEYAVSLIQGK